MKTATTLSVYKFLELMPGESEAVAFVERQVWGDVPVCPFCKGTKSTPRINRKGHHCKGCRRYFTVRIGTVLENSLIPMHKWLYAMCLVVTGRKGISSLQLSKEIGITQKSAWFLLHRIRAMCADDIGMLTGMVEIDEVYLGGREGAKHADKRQDGTQGRSTKTKVAVVGMRERGGKVKAKAVQAYIAKKVSSGSVLSTDEASIYTPVKSHTRFVVNHSAKEYVSGMASTNGIESVWALLKRGFHGTYHHFSRKHVDRYVSEVTFRLKRRQLQG